MHLQTIESESESSEETNWANHIELQAQTSPSSKHKSEPSLVLIAYEGGDKNTQTNIAYKIRPRKKPKIEYKIKKKRKIPPTSPKRASPDPKYSHQWRIGMEYDVDRDEIVINVADDQTGRQWRKVISNDSVDNGVDLREHCLRLGSFITDGITTYEVPLNGKLGIGCVTVELCKEGQIYKFSADPI